MTRAIYWRIPSTSQKLKIDATKTFELSNTEVKQFETDQEVE
jgi:hypothetical protein